MTHIIPRETSLHQKSFARTTRDNRYGFLENQSVGKITGMKDNTPSNMLLTGVFLVMFLLEGN
ncbi:MAG: hypothetical protein BWY09_02533 [Candidatus Hydrogenedentes bacterium ADurb.Bin179]|nr:MAG: hypothetical protein BWY09_02533 [Candidatus Hydrogenedentes bacterium ADurb.Bin179]